MRDLWDFLFPSIVTCWSCSVKIDKPMHTKAWMKLCLSCLTRFSEISGALCIICGCMIEGTADKLCLDCTQFKSERCVYNRSCVRYTPWTRSIMHLYKHKGKESLFLPLSSWMVEAVYRYFTNCSWDMLTWVPLHKERIRDRGFNQSELLCSAISSSLKLPQASLLTRRCTTVPQSKLSRRERLTALKGMFELVQGHNIDLKGKSILLVDDVYTTGSTLRSCAEALYGAGVNSVYSITFAR